MHKKIDFSSFKFNTFTKNNRKWGITKSLLFNIQCIILAVEQDEQTLSRADQAERDTVSESKSIQVAKHSVRAQQN